MIKNKAELVKDNPVNYYKPIAQIGSGAFAKVFKVERLEDFTDETKVAE